MIPWSDAGHSLCVPVGSPAKMEICPEHAKNRPEATAATIKTEIRHLGCASPRNGGRLVDRDGPR